MKLDVEGHEFELLPLPVFEPQHVHNMVIEFQDIDTRRSQFVALMQLLRSRGYRIASNQNVELSPEAVEQLSSVQCSSCTDQARW